MRTIQTLTSRLTTSLPNDKHRLRPFIQGHLSNPRFFRETPLPTGSIRGPTLHTRVYTFHHQVLGLCRQIINDIMVPEYIYLPHHTTSLSSNILHGPDRRLPCSQIKGTIKGSTASQGGHFIPITHNHVPRIYNVERSLYLCAGMVHMSSIAAWG